MKVLITGANGFLGQHLSVFLHDSFKIVATGRGRNRLPSAFQGKYVSCRLEDELAVHEYLGPEEADVIIHCAAMSKPDECNANREACIASNVLATENIIKLARKTSAFVVFISTDFVFGDDGPHAEDALPSPLNFYGHTKLMAEKIVEESGLPYAIVRPVFIYGPVWFGLRDTFIQWVKKSLGNKEPLKIVGDQLRTPTYVYDICKGIERIVSGKKQGIFHLAGKDILSPYQLAVKVARFFKLDESLIEEVNSESFPEEVKRAKKSGLLIERAKRELDYSPVGIDQGIALSFLST